MPGTTGTRHNIIGGVLIAVFNNSIFLILLVTYTILVTRHRLFYEYTTMVTVADTSTEPNIYIAN